MGEFVRDQPDISKFEPLGRGRKQPMTPRKHLRFDETYRCPACGSGELSAIAMMDVFACDFCRHMFTANLESQSVQLADSLQMKAWQWNGWKWHTAAQRADTDAVLMWVFGSVLTVTPVALIAMSNYMFPPLEGSSFPMMWTGLTLTSHAVISGWLLAEYYQWPWYLSGRIRLQRLREQLRPAEA